MPSALTTTATLLALLLAGCGHEASGSDADADGWTVEDGDCDDEDPSIHPGASEVVADGIDQDCDGGDTCYYDADVDGYGSTETTASEDLDCLDPGESIRSTDCKDRDPAISPGAEETLADGVDQDCDGGEICFEDLDGDGYGTATLLVSPNTTCSDPGESPVATDCDDGDALVHPGAAEVCNGRDDDCTGSPAPEESDVDADGWMGCEGDCDDGDPSVHPGAVEVVADGVDQDCDGGDLCYADADGDGYGSAATVASTDLDCADAGESSVSSDCGDGSAEVHPEATETCDGEDDDCDGEVDEDDAADAATWYADTDGDRYGDPSAPYTSCEAPTGYVADATDCDDSRADVYPGNPETCDGEDDDCDGEVDEDAIDPSTFWTDADGDGHGDPGAPLEACDLPDGAVENDDDCDDTDPAVWPGAEEVVADGVDQDCDGGDVCYQDDDGDHYGGTTTRASSDLDCSDAGESDVATDCNDHNRGVHPDAREGVADELDQDCDGGELCYADEDGDGFGGEDTVASEDLDCSDVGESDEDTDCDDTDPAVYEDAEEIVADGIDEDCDGRELCFWDGDGDGWGESRTHSSSSLDCTGYHDSPYDTDCDDDDPDIHPGATEICGDGVDGDCDGLADDPPECEECTDGIDDDGDGLVDCEDGDCAGMEPCEETVCDDGLDGDGDGLTDCSDDDCWGPACHPAGVRSRVLSGNFEEAYDRIWHHWEGCSLYGGHAWLTWERRDREILLHSVRGTVQVLPSGAASWDATTARTTCAWSLASAGVDSRSWTGFSGGGGGLPWGTAYWGVWYPDRTGLHVDSGCRLAASSWFLPALVVPGCRAGEVAIVAYDRDGSYGPCRLTMFPSLRGPIWYAGTLGPGTGTRMTSHTTGTATHCPVGSGDIESTHWLYTGVLSTGSVYTALP